MPHGDERCVGRIIYFAFKLVVRFEATCLAFVSSYMIALIGEIAKTGEKSSDCNIWWDEMAPGLRKTQENNTDWKIGRMRGCLIPDTAGLKVPMLSQTVSTIAVAF